MRRGRHHVRQHMPGRVLPGQGGGGRRVPQGQGTSQATSRPGSRSTAGCLCVSCASTTNEVDQGNSRPTALSAVPWRGFRNEASVAAAEFTRLGGGEQDDRVRSVMNCMLVCSLCRWALTSARTVRASRWTLCAARTASRMATSAWRCAAVCRWCRRASAPTEAMNRNEGPFSVAGRCIVWCMRM